MKKYILLALFVFSTTVSAGTAFFQYERSTGMTKQCVYDYLGSSYTITIQSHQLCPLTINV